MRDRLAGHHDLGLRTFPLIKLDNLGLEVDRKMRRIDKGPRRVRVKVRVMSIVDKLQRHLLLRRLANQDA